MRILIISSNPISTTDNNGKTLRSFFRQFPKEDLATLYFHPNLKPDFDTCSNLYRINEINILKSIFNLSFTAKNTAPKQDDFQIVGKGSNSSLFSHCKNLLKHLPAFREALWKLNTWDTDELNQWISDFKPDIVFAMLGDSIFAHKMALKISKRYSIPLAVYFTDDYILNDYSSNFIEKRHIAKLRKIYSYTVNNAHLLYAIGDKMAAAYSNYFGKKFGVLINCIDFSKQVALEPLKISQDHDIIISYLGGLHYNRWKSICRVGRAFRTRKDIHIRVFSGQQPDDHIMENFHNSGVEFCGSLTEQEVGREIAKSHFLIHAESFSPQDKAFTQYSVSTKIPEYMSSNRQIICIGPSDIASVELLEQNGFGILINEKDTDEEISNKIIKAIENYDSFDFKRQYDFALSKFDKTAIAANLKKDFSSLLD